MLICARSGVLCFDQCRLLREAALDYSADVARAYYDGPPFTLGPKEQAPLSPPTRDSRGDLVDQYIGGVRNRRDLT